VIIIDNNFILSVSSLGKINLRRVTNNIPNTMCVFQLENISFLKKAIARFRKI